MQQKRLGDIASYINGFAFKPEQRGKVGLPIIRIQDLTGNAYDLGFYDGDYPKKVEIDNGDVLISWSASLGVYEWNRGKALLNQHIFKVVFDKLTVDKKFFMYAVQYKLGEMESKTHGATMKHITKKDFDNTTIPFPIISEQKTISDTLGKLYAIIADKRLQLEKLDDLVKARFVEMFGNDKYKTRTIKDVLCESFWLMPATPKYIEKGIPYITSKNIKNRILDLNDTKYISEDDYLRISKNRPVKPGDILVSMIGTLGQTAVVPKDKRFYGQNVYLLRLNGDIVNTPFFCEFFNSDDVQYKLTGKSNQSTQAYLKANHVEELSIPIPPIAIQNEFANLVAQVDKSKFALSNELTMCNFYIRLIHDRVMHGRINL